MLHDINLTFDNQYKNAAMSSTDIAICIKNDSILASVNKGKIEFPPVSCSKETGVYLFTLDNTNYYFVNELPETAEFIYYKISSIRNLKPKASVFAGITGYHICRWYSDNKFCGRCGNPMQHSKTERAMVCDCGITYYPKISPAVIVAILDDDKILLTKYNREFSDWALVAGYNEIGETIEETVRREVMEETGLKIKNLHYYKSQPWGLSSSLLFGFICNIDGNNTVSIDKHELKEARWFTREEISFEDDHISLTREMINAFKNEKLCL